MEDIVDLLRKRAEIRRQIPTRKSVQENRPDRFSSLLEDAANEILQLRGTIADLQDVIEQYKAVQAGDKW